MVIPYPEKNNWYISEPRVPTINPSSGPDNNPATRIGKASKVNLKFASLIGVIILNTVYIAISIAKVVSLFVFMFLSLYFIRRN